MCRWLAYSGSPIRVEDLIFKPDYSLIQQSQAARHTEHLVNGDGFGLGWYGVNDTPGLYTSTQPAWNDHNLRDLTAHIDSSLFIAHIRAATGGSVVQHSNCHPFRYKNWLFAHNGLIEHFSVLRRDLTMAVDPALYPFIKGTTDSEVLFYLSLSFGLMDDPYKAVNETIDLVESVAKKHRIEKVLQMTLGMSDGKKIYALRYATDKEPRSLFYSRNMTALKELSPELRIYGDDCRVIVSEPLTDLHDHWREVPPYSTVTIENGQALIGSLR